MDVRLRVLLAVLLIIAPSVLFVLLYRGLLRLQDQELIARLAEAGHLDSDSLERVGTGSHGDRNPERERSGRRAGEPGRNAGVAERRAAFLRERTDSPLADRIASPRCFDRRGFPFRRVRASRDRDDRPRLTGR